MRLSGTSLIPLCQAISGVKSMIEERSNRPRKLNRAGAMQAMAAMLAFNLCPRPTVSIESDKSCRASSVPGCGRSCSGPRVCRRFRQYGTARPITKRIRSKTGVWNGQSKDNTDAVTMSRWKRNPKYVNPITTEETEQSIPQRYRERANSKRTN